LKKDHRLQILSWNLRSVRLANRLRVGQMARIIGIQSWQLWLLERSYCSDVTIDFLLDFDRHFDVQPWELFEKRLLGRKDAGVPGSCAEDGSA